MKHATPHLPHSICRILLMTVLLLSMATPSIAQESAFLAHPQRSALLPGNVSNVSVVDSHLYCFASGVLFKAKRSGEEILEFWADTDFVKLGEGIEYVTQRPNSNEIYYTRRDSKGKSYLYCCTAFGTSDEDSRQIKFGGGFFNKGMTVEHPTFSADGKVMVFASLEKSHSEGGYDLWYSLYENGQWAMPVNLGNRINTSADEVSPSIYNDWLIFSSNGHPEDNGHMSLYSSRLIADHVIGDTVGMLQIGRSRVQRLPVPLNSAMSDDFDMAYDKINNCGYWVSTRTTSSTDSQLFSFPGVLNGIFFWGVIRDRRDDLMPGVRVEAIQDGKPVCHTYTDVDGQYRLYLQCNQNYEIKYQLDNHFIEHEFINTTKDGDENLISDFRRDIVLHGLLVGERLIYNDLFGPDADIELSDFGIEQLDPLVRFLNDNPTLIVDMTLANDITTDGNFNRMLTQRRIQTVENYLKEHMIPSIKVSIENGCSGTSGCSDGTGRSRLTVVLREK